MTPSAPSGAAMRELIKGALELSHSAFDRIDADPESRVGLASNAVDAAILALENNDGLRMQLTLGEVRERLLCHNGCNLTEQRIDTITDELIAVLAHKEIAALNHPPS